jgi:hypothetical protein
MTDVSPQSSRGLIPLVSFLISLTTSPPLRAGISWASGKQPDAGTNIAVLHSREEVDT